MTRRLFGALALLCALATASTALAQTLPPPSVQTPSGGNQPVTPAAIVYPDASTGAPHTVRPGDGLPVNCVTGCASASIPTTTDRSAAITTGGTAQNLFAVNASRKAFYVFNPDAAEIAWCSFTTTAAANGQGSFPVYAQGGFGMEQNAPTQALSCIAATTNHKLTAWDAQ